MEAETSRDVPANSQRNEEASNEEASAAIEGIAAYNVDRWASIEVEREAIFAPCSLRRSAGFLAEIIALVARRGFPFYH